MESVKVFDDKFQTIIKDGFMEAIESKSKSGPVTAESVPDRKWSVPDNSLTCSYCRIQFQDSLQQREHYKFDWHRYNLKQSLLNKEPVTEEEFNGKTEQDEISSISGSDSESSEVDSVLAAQQGKIFLQSINHNGTVFSLFACLLSGEKLYMKEISEYLSKLKECTCSKPQWTVLMLGGGHFAGAVFYGETPILHKTFHCYTVRAGQGSVQSSRDNVGSHPKSAGASLRRYNEQSQIQHVRSITENWRESMAKSSLIFFRAAGPYNKAVLFGGSSPILNKNDDRLRPIPFSTRRATFAEVKRVHAILCTVQVYDSYKMAAEYFTQQKMSTIKRNNNKSTRRERDKSREINERRLEETIVPTSPSHSSSSSSLEGCCSNFIVEDEEILFDLQEFTDSLTPEQRKPKRKHIVKKSKTKKAQEQGLTRKRAITDLITKGFVKELTALLDTNSLQIDEILDDEGNNTILHLAAINEHSELVKVLLEKGANPCLKNRQHQTVYTITQNRDIRQMLRDFARENPDKYNYNKAQIPLNCLTEEELAEKRKQQRKIKKEKEKIRRLEKEIKRKEEEEKERFLRLSDREKRALAAERRILNESSGRVVAIRCFLCAQDITGKVPFEYLGNRFCSVECLKGHRMKNPVIL